MSSSSPWLAGIKGSKTRNRVSAGIELTWIEPECRRTTMLLTMSSPRPAEWPVSLVVKNGSKIRDWICSGIPGPRRRSRRPDHRPRPWLGSRCCRRPRRAAAGNRPQPRGSSRRWRRSREAARQADARTDTARRSAVWLAAPPRAGCRSDLPGHRRRSASPRRGAPPAHTTGIAMRTLRFQVRRTGGPGCLPLAAFPVIVTSRSRIAPLCHE